MDTLDLNYIFEASRIKAIFYYIDILLISSVFVLSGFAVSTYLNNRITRTLNRDNSKVTVFFQILSELLLTITIVTLLFYLLPKIPTIVYFPSKEHQNQRTFPQHFLLAFAVLSCQTKLQDKVAFLLNKDLDRTNRLQDEVNDNYENCPNGFTCA